jgi:mRNA interferase HigB
MHAISERALREFWTKHPSAQLPLEIWYKIVSRADFSNFGALKRVFPSVDKVGDLYVFNIGGNKFRLIAAIHFNRKKLFIRHVLTHKQYDAGEWKNG